MKIKICQKAYKALVITSTIAGAIIVFVSLASRISGYKLPAGVMFLIFVTIFVLATIMLYAILRILLDMIPIEKLGKTSRGELSQQETSICVEHNDEIDDVIESSPITIEEQLEEPIEDEKSDQVEDASAEMLSENRLKEEESEKETNLPIDITKSEEEKLFEAKYVYANYRNKMIYRIIKRNLETRSGGANAIAIFAAAKKLKWITNIPGYTEAIKMFDVKLIGSSSNYSTYKSNVDKDNVAIMAQILTMELESQEKQ